MSDQFDRLKAALADRYAIERPLGRGGMATVYLATDLRHNRPVAVKVLHPELSATLGAERFLREIEIAANLTHPHILPLHESGQAEGFLYYVMPYVEGETLRERLNSEKQLPLDDSLRIAREVADALSYAHGHDVVHRDIKPENILLESGHAVVADFGIARAITAAGGEKLTATGIAVGTPAYMSPEQGSGEQQLDGRSDIYSLGCVLYEMLAGDAPFSGASAQAILARKSVEAVPSIRVVRETVPVTIETAIEKALAKVPADRFATAHEFAAALEPALTSAPAPAPRPRRGIRARPVALVGLIAIVLGGWWISRTFMGVGTPGIESLAVLPFYNVSGDPEQEYFVAGMHDALIGQLAQIGALRVISRTSALRYKDSDKSLPEIARELNVDMVVEASVLRTGDSVRIQVQLIEAFPEERNLWAQTYDRDVRDVLAMHSDVVRAIAGEIEVTLTPQDKMRLASARTVNPEAYEAYLKGMFHWFRLTPQDLETAMQYFELALAKDSNYALAYTGIASVWGARQQFGLVPPREATPRARAAVLTALELDSTLAEAHFVLASLRTWSDWDWEGGETAFRRAIALNPNYAHARAFYSLLLNVMGRPEEAIAQIERALELDPFNHFFQNNYALDLMFVRRYDDAIVQARNVLRTVPNFAPAHAQLWGAFHQKQMYDEALAQARNFASVRGDREVEEALERGYAEGGYREAMHRAAETLVARSRTTYVAPRSVARWYARAGENGRALEWLERAYEARDPTMVFLGSSPDWDSLRDDPRFQDLLRRMNLPQ